jgi:hypothetical protein
MFTRLTSHLEAISPRAATSPLRATISTNGEGLGITTDAEDTTPHPCLHPHPSHLHPPHPHPHPHSPYPRLLRQPRHPLPAPPLTISTTLISTAPASMTLSTAPQHPQQLPAPLTQHPTPAAPRRTLQQSAARVGIEGGGIYVPHARTPTAAHSTVDFGSGDTMGEEGEMITGAAAADPDTDPATQGEGGKAGVDRAVPSPQPHPEAEPRQSDPSAPSQPHPPGTLPMKDVKLSKASTRSLAY